MIARKLLAVEWLKIRRRFAFIATVGFFYGLITLMSGGAYYEHLQNPGGTGITLPDDWKELPGGLGSIIGMIVIVLVTLLTASERTWRTERQNVIDGLSRSQYFAAKLILVAFLIVLMWAGLIVIITTFGLLDRTITPSDAPLFDALSLQLLCALLLRMFVLGIIAFLFSMITSGAGAALAFSIIFLMAQEPLILAFADKSELMRTIAPYSLGKVLEGVTNPATYDSVRLAQMNAQLENFGFGSPMLSAARSAFVAALYAVVFATGAWLSIRKRDL